MLHLLHERATASQIKAMLEANDGYIAVAVDVERGSAAGGGELPADGAAVLLEAGSRQEQIWGAVWEPKTRTVRSRALINAHPQLKNGTREIRDADIRGLVEAIVRRLLDVS